ncbi:GNAT family N-acetyltransferase [Algihabitans sp.]|uniref:GNAT family N-acetyltransferase n=1 Tax=Algihabitans sp. TaxID=2821514 RepID=UPI003BAAA55E
MNPSGSFTIERATASEADEIAALYIASRNDALPYLPALHSDAEIRQWISDVMLRRGGTWIGRLDGRIVGFFALVDDDLEQLYVHPEFYRRGIGSRLLDKAKTLSLRRLRLFTFQRNGRARAFYEAKSFTMIDSSDGSRNEEREPDCFYEWAKDV